MGDRVSVTFVRNQITKRLKPIHQGLHRELQRSGYLHVDETGWRLDGDNQWLWNFSNNKVSVSHIDKSRGQKVLQDVLGKKFGGVLISDFLSAYNKIEALAKQRCLVHLQRDLTRVRECLTDDMAVQRFVKRLECIINQARTLKDDYIHKRVSKSRFRSKRKSLEESLDDLNFSDPQHRVLQRFVKRLNRHKGEILTFLHYPEIDSNNNKAEREIRPNVLLRKIVFGNRSQKGIENHNVIMSVIQTAKLNGREPLQMLQRLIFNPRLGILIRSPAE